MTPGTRLARGELARLQELSGELHSMRESLVMVLERISSGVQLGAPVGQSDMAQLEGWQAKLAEAALALNREPGEFTLPELDEAVAAALSQLAVEEQNAEIRRLLADIAAVGQSEEGTPLGVMAEQARNADLQTMPEETRAAFRALHRLMNAPLRTADPADAEAVRVAFGLPTVLAAAGALLGSEPGRRSGPEPEPPPKVAPEPAGSVLAAPPSAHKRHPVREQRPVADRARVGIEAGPSGPYPPEAKPTEPEVDGSPPDLRIADALMHGHTGLAYWYCVALELPTAVRTAFEVLALSEAITADGDVCSGRIRELLHDFDVTSIAQNPDFLGVLAAGSARALLRMPFSRCAAILQDAVTFISDEETNAFLTAVLHASAFGLELGKLREEDGGSPAELIARRDAALRGLSSAMRTAKLSKTRYARATNVWRRFISDKGPLGTPVCAILAKPEDVEPEDLEPAEDVLALLRDQRAIDRLIDDTDLRLNPVAARRSKIVAGARDELRQHTTDLLDALGCYVEAARAMISRHRAGTSDQLGEAVEALTRAVGAPKDNTATVADTAIGLVKSWLRSVLIDQIRFPEVELPIGAVLARDLSRCFEVQRLDDGTVAPESVTPEILDHAKRSAEQAYEGFVANDDHLGAEQLIEVLRGEGQSALADQLAARRQEDLRNSRERVRNLLAEAERELDRALYEALLSETKSAELRAELERLRGLDVVDFIAAKDRLEHIIKQVALVRDGAIEDARHQLEGLDLAGVDRPDEVRARVLHQLDQGDLVNAHEFLAQLAMGAPGLPPESPADETLTEFWPSFVNAVAAINAGQPDQPTLRWLEEAAAGHEDIAGFTLLPPDSSPAIARGLRGWLDLTRNKRGSSSNWQESLKDVLNLLGLEVKPPFDRTPHRLQRWWTEIQAVPVGQALVHTYGSSCGGSYQLMLCWDKVSADKLVELLGEKPQQPPVIVLYFNTMPTRERRRLAEQSRPINKDRFAVTVDNAVIAFLASRTEARLQTTMGIGLPFTAINPYTPFALGDVPREVFYGRKEELRRVQDANDALFVYGGRQLGKSALLKTAMREFAQTDTRWRSIYVDLRAEGVGEWREPDDIWPVILPHLQTAGIVDAKVSAKATAGVVVPQIRRWLDADSGRRILLLLDEADAFLETDSRARSGLPGESRFINVYHLKGLMDGSNRRFKPVFAGLHQVQRFHSASNGPMAHVGTEILIGPLPAPEAYKLVVKPLAAVGYRFHRPDVAWRLLAYTNYQASLIQHFCRVLVDRLSHRSLAADAPPTVISDRDIDGIYGDKDVRDHIASRFELTINLDNRYRVIAYATAGLTLDTSAQVFPAIALYDECKAFWADGFAALSLDDFAAYLDEMVGLGVLVRTRADEYGIRSPNVIRLLGSPEEIERRLLESEYLELSRPFDSAMFRRALGGDPDRRSPLSEQQVQQILNGRGHIHVVVGSTALCIDRAVEALREAASEGVEVRAAACGTLHEVITGLTRADSGYRHIVLDLGDADESEQLAALQRLHKWMDGDSPRRTASCLAPPSADWLWQGEVFDVPVERVRIKPWTHDSLRAWAPECEYPLGTAGQRAKLLEITGGWPLLVEEAARAARGAPEAKAREKAAALLSDGEAAAQFLLSVGLWADPDVDEVAAVASNWAAEISFDELVTLVKADAEATLASVTRLVDLGVLSAGSSSDTYVVNPLIATLLRDE